MDIRSVTVTQREVQRELARAVPVTPAGALKEDGCTAYSRVKPVLQIGIVILGQIYPPAAAALATVIIIMDKACADEVTKKKK